MIRRTSFLVQDPWVLKDFLREKENIDMKIERWNSIINLKRNKGFERISGSDCWRVLENRNQPQQQKNNQWRIENFNQDFSRIPGCDFQRFWPEDIWGIVIDCLRIYSRICVCVCVCVLFPKVSWGGGEFSKAFSRVLFQHLDSIWNQRMGSRRSWRDPQQMPRFRIGSGSVQDRVRIAGILPITLIVGHSGRSRWFRFPETPADPDPELPWRFDFSERGWKSVRIVEGIPLKRPRAWWKDRGISSDGVSGSIPCLDTRHCWGSAPRWMCRQDFEGSLCRSLQDHLHYDCGISRWDLDPLSGRILNQSWRVLVTCALWRIPLRIFPGIQ